MILGLDVSTQKIGVAIIDREKNIIYSSVIKLPKEETLLEKADTFRNEIEYLFEHHDIKKIAIEEALMMFGNRSSMAQVISLLQRFNGMVSYITYDVFGIEPDMVNVNSARKKIGIKIDRKIKHKKPRDKKQPIIDHVVEMYKDSKTPITIKLNRNLNYSDGEDDRIDALIVALSQIS